MRMYPLSRRDFIRQALFGVCGAALLPLPAAMADERVPERFLGKTRTPVSLLSIHVPSLAQGKSDEEVVGLIRKAVDVCGKPVISLSGEGQAEASKLAGNALQGAYRKKAFITAATTATDKQGALSELERTLDALQIESLDLWLLDESIYQNGAEAHFFPGWGDHGGHRSQEAGIDSTPRLQRIPGSAIFRAYVQQLF